MNLGKRVCPSEQLAKMFYFLLIASFVKHFQLKAIENEPLPTLEPIKGISISYQAFKAVVISR